MAIDMAAISNLGPFKANKPDPEGMLDDFNTYRSIQEFSHSYG